MKKMRYLAVMIAAVISAATLLGGCGSSGEAMSNTPETTTTAATTAAPETTTAAETTEAPAVTEEKVTLAKDAVAPDGAPAKKDKSIIAKIQEGEQPEAPAEVEAAPSAYAQAIAKTVWAGMDSNYNCYALAFSETEVKFACDDGSSLDGYWAVADGDPTFYIFSDPECTECIGAIPWTLDSEKGVIVLNENIAMAQTDANSFDAVIDTLKKTATACKVAAYLDGTYWVGTDESDGAISAINMKDQYLNIYEVTTDGNEQVANFIWGLDYDALTLYDEEFNPIFAFNWNFADDGSWLDLSTENTSVRYTQVAADTAEAVYEYLHELAAQYAEAGQGGAEINDEVDGYSEE